VRESLLLSRRDQIIEVLAELFGKICKCLRISAL
jgi:hypothetical protein